MQEEIFNDLKSLLHKDRINILGCSELSALYEKTKRNLKNFT